MFRYNPLSADSVVLFEIRIYSGVLFRCNEIR